MKIYNKKEKSWENEKNHAKNENFDQEAPKKHVKSENNKIFLNFLLVQVIQ